MSREAFPSRERLPDAVQQRPRVG